MQHMLVSIESKFMGMHVDLPSLILLQTNNVDIFTSGTSTNHWLNLDDAVFKSWHIRQSHVRWELLLGEHDTQTGMLSRNTSERKMRSKIWWFTEFCNSHYLSHFAAFFIVAGAKISVVKSCLFINFLVIDLTTQIWINICYVLKLSHGKWRESQTATNDTVVRRIT